MVESNLTVKQFFDLFRGNRMIQCPEKGFTLIEVMIVIAIMAIMAAFAAPNYGHYMAQRRLNGAARQIMSELMTARMQAVSQQNTFKLSFPNNHEYTILDDDDNDGTADSGELLVTRDIQSEYYSVTTSSTASPIFYGRGTANGATITVSNSAGSKNVVVEITGCVRIAD